MHDTPRQKLRELIVEYGRSLCDDPRRCEALLRDYCGQHKREIFVLVSALKNRVAEDLLKAPAGIPQSMVLARLYKRLEDELAMTTEAAHWAVESWALALGVIVQPSPMAKPTPVSSAPLSTARKVMSAPPTLANKPLIAPRYRDNDDGTVTDVLTGLQWMRFSLGQEWKNGTCTGQAKKYTWQEALHAADALNRQGGYAGYRDWRVPTKEELQKLLAGTQSPKIDQAAFPNTPASASWYWSSSIGTGYPDGVCYVNFNDGYVYSYDKVYSTHVRLVRGGL